MSVLIRNGRAEPDDFVSVADDAPVPDLPAILSLARWQNDRGELVARVSSIGVRIPNTADVIALWPELQELKLIVLDFPSFSDGRAYSQAHQLRARCGYTGELRAVGGAVARDQILSMQRSGFSSFELRADQDPDGCLAALKDFSLAYQPGLSQLPLVPALRRKALSR